MQPSRRRPDQLGQPCLDVEVNVFQLALENEFPGRDFLFDGIQACRNRSRG
jgi:hypothetical protein